MRTPPPVSAATQATGPPLHLELLETRLQTPLLWHANIPFCPTAQRIPAASSQADCTVAKGKPDAGPARCAARGLSRLRPPPRVLTQTLPSESSRILMML